MRKRVETLDIFNTTLLVLFGLAVLFPFYNAFVTSIVPQADFTRNPFILFPKRVISESYLYVLYSQRVWSGYIVTLLVVLIGVPYNLFMTLTMAYALSRRKFLGMNAIMNMIIFTMFFGGGLIPYYLLVKNLGLRDSIFAMIIPYGLNAFYMLICRNFFRTLPASLEESAYMDGANELRILWSIILPLSKPVIATVALFYAVDRWNEWWNGLLFIRDLDRQPLQLVLRNIISTIQSSDANGVPFAIRSVVFSEGVKMASIFVTMLPIMLVYPFLQKFFMKGILIGAIKS
jgi:putative aldouronate transport system permease protein